MAGGWCGFLADFANSAALPAGALVFVFVGVVGILSVESCGASPRRTPRLRSGQAFEGGCPYTGLASAHLFN